jgi:uncharacterized protein YuzE
MEKTITSKISNSVFQAVPFLIDFPTPRYWVDYDGEADVLYISFQRPQKATDSKMTDDGILLRYRGKKLVGITVLDASTRSFNKRMKKLRVKS